MEPTNLNPADPEDPIGNLLRCQSDEALPDHGFTARVLANLPETPLKEPKRPRAFSRRSLLIGAATLIAALVWIGNNALPANVNASVNFFDLAHELEVITSDQGVIWGLSILVFSFATLWYLDSGPDVAE